MNIATSEDSYCETRALRVGPHRGNYKLALFQDTYAGCLSLWITGEEEYAAFQLFPRLQLWDENTAKRPESQCISPTETWVQKGRKRSVFRPIPDYRTNSYRLQRFAPIFRTRPPSTRPASSRWTIFSLYWGKLETMSLMPRTPPVLRISKTLSARWDEVLAS